MKKKNVEVEKIKNVIRKYRGQLKTLKRKLNRYNKSSVVMNDEDDFEPELRDKIIEDIRPTCPRCGGFLQEIDIAVKSLIICDSCDYRTTKNYKGK